MKPVLGDYRSEYKKLNRAQKEAVDSIDGPVMVVAGPGTGKTQVLALRIANILEKTDIKADGILCLTFTNSAVEAMKKRLVNYIGKAGEEVDVFTFHSFGMKMIESYFQVLDLPAPPKLLDDADTTILFAEILNGNEWQYLRPRADPSRYFSDLRSLISLLKRERITSKTFLAEVEKEIKSLSKGELKKDLKKTESLERTKEVVKFWDLYEKEKRAKNLLDYDDVLENLVKIVETSNDARGDIQERYLYVLVDEHQDSSRVQNEFLAQVWGSVEAPNIFVVGDDRQLIYGFSGASIDHFQGFKKTFKGSKLITLVDNYRSTQVILDASHALLQSTMTNEKLLSQSRESHPIRIFETQYPRDEIIAAARDIKEKKLKLTDCAILLPKNAQVREALEILHKEGLAVSPFDALNLFDQEEANALFRVLKIVSGLDEGEALALSLFDKTSNVPPLEAHAYLLKTGISLGVENWLKKLDKWKKETENKNLLDVAQVIGGELLLGITDGSGNLVNSKEILDTMLALASREVEKNPDLTLGQFVSFVHRLESYGEHIPVVVDEREGVRVLTLHSSKGLEFDYVWIAHMSERSLNSAKKGGFTLPEYISERLEEQDGDKVKRKLYVAITRAKRFCTLSYARYSSKDSPQEVAKIIADLPEEVFIKQKVNSENESKKIQTSPHLSALLKSVGQKYNERYVSVSLLNNFFECPWKWYFRNLLKLPEEKSESLEFGDKVHKAIDVILKTGQLPLDKEILKVLGDWVEKRLPEISKKRENELSVSFTDPKFPHFHMYGRIDLLENLSDGSARVTDFKTGSVKKKSEIEKRDEEGRLGNLMRQLAMYSYLLEGNAKWQGVKVSGSRLEFLEAKDLKESIYDHVVTEEEIGLLKKDIQDYDQLIKSGEWVNRSCNYNSYGRNTECEYCKLAEIYK